MHRDEIVKTISTFYTFLVTNTLLPTTAIKTPPSKGWPEEYRQAFRKMGKSEEVVDLLSHLPYIDDPNWEWLNETKPINYISSLNLRRLNGDYESKRYLFEPSEFKFPSHVVSLTTGRLYGSWLLLDLHAGTITEFSVLGGRSWAYGAPEEMVTSGTTWRLYPTKPIREFFAEC